MGAHTIVLALAILFFALLPAATAVPTQIKIATNRFVINDDPMAGTVGSGGCINSSAGSWGTDYWSGEKVRIRAYALVLNESGLAQTGINVTFTITNSTGWVINTGSNLTDSIGLANYSFSMNNLGGRTNGTYTITASNGSISASRTFYYTYMGCTNCHGNPGSNMLNDPWLFTNSTPYSGNASNMMEPMHTTYFGRSQHQNTIVNGQCTYCHTLYGYPTATPSQTGGPSANPGGLFPWGVHSNVTGTGVTCWTCHLGARTVGAFPPAPDCFGARCHGGNATVQHNTNLTKYTTWNAINDSVFSFNSTNVSNMSSWTITPLKAHKGTRNVPCIICHGPVHNITKPGLSPSQAENATYSNSWTEDTFCQWCHTNISDGGVRTRHNGMVPCTVCHSQDIHNISFATNRGDAYTQNRSQAVDCTGCHQGNWTAILNRSKVNYYTGSGAPQIPVPLNHSDNNGGQRWGQYWGDLPATNATMAVSAEGVTNGTTTGVSGTQTVDGLFETLTEALVTIAQNVSTYVTDITLGNGTVANFANMQSATDGGAFANISENLSGPFNTTNYIINSNLSLLTGQAARNWTYTETDPNANISNFTSGSGNTLPGGSGARGYVINTTATTVIRQNLVGRINQSFVAPPYILNITSRFAWNASFNAIAAPATYRVRMYLNYMNGTLLGTLYDSGNITNLTMAWAWYGNDSITTNLTAGTRYNLYVQVDFNAGGGGNITRASVMFDDVYINITRYTAPPVFHLDFTTNITNIPMNYENYTLQIMANASGSEAINVSVQNSTGAYNYKGQVSGATMQQYNFSIVKAMELLPGGIVSVMFTDTNTSSDNTSLGSLLVDFERVYANTSNPNNYQLDVVQNITGVPLAQDSYNLTIMGNTSSGGENFDLYVYNFDSGQFVLKNATTFNASNTWHNFALSSSEISPGGVVSIQWVDSNTSKDSVSQDDLTLDFVGVYYREGAVVGLLPCLYCHGNTKHNASALGRVEEAYQGTNYKNGTINSTSFWCGACHYPSNPYYQSMTNLLLVDNGAIPPDNTNYSTAQGGFNHSDTLAASSSDDVCKGCHGGLLVGNSMAEFVHNVQVGKACTGCHFSFSTMNGTYGRPTKYINQTMFTATVHGALDCLNCHTVTSNATASHPGGNASIFTPPEYGWKWCEDCHEVQPVDGNLVPVISPPQNKTGRHNLTNMPKATSYNISGALKSALEITDCTACHDSTVYNSAKATYNRSIGKDCRYCHTLPDKTPGSP